MATIVSPTMTHIKLKDTPVVGDRVRITGLMKDEPDPIPIDEEGTIVAVNTFCIWGEKYQLNIEWDSGRTLFLLECDSFEVIDKDIVWKNDAESKDSSPISVMEF